MIKQRRIELTSTIVELVSEDPGRTGFFVQNLDDESIGGIYARKDNPHGAIYLYPHCWFYFEKEDDPNKQWWIKYDAGTGNVHVVEFYHKPETGQRTWV